MPEFCLDFPKAPPLPPLKRDFVSKNEYSHKVKVERWDEHKLALPLDYDAHNPPGGNQHKASYIRLGNLKEPEWISETHERLKDVFKKKSEMPINKTPMFCYGNYNETRAEPETFPDEYTPDFLTTMQADYRMPYPYVIKPLSIPVAPFNFNRRLRGEDATYETNKFLDDCTLERVKEFQKIKAVKFKSYNPFTGEYSDGSKIIEVKPKCFDLPFQHT